MGEYSNSDFIKRMGINRARGKKINSSNQNLTTIEDELKLKIRQLEVAHCVGRESAKEIIAKAGSDDLRRWL